MGDKASLEAAFLENLPLIDRTAASLARRNGLIGVDAEDFISWVRLRMIEADYAVLKKFRGDASIGTYLTVVIAMLARDYRVQKFGRWRPSAFARRVGHYAVRLEMLVRRQGYRLEEAGEVLRTAGETQLSDRDLRALLAQIPTRQILRPVEAGSELLDTVEGSAYADTLLVGSEVQSERERIVRVLQEIIETLPIEDRLIVRMRFYDELTVAEIARALAIEQKPLYKRLERLLAELRRQLIAAGVSLEQCQGFILDPMGDV